MVHRTIGILWHETSGELPTSDFYKLPVFTQPE